VRSVAAVITGVFAFVFGVPILGELLPRWWQDHVFDYMLLDAAGTITNTNASSALAPETAVLVVAVRMAVLLAVTWALLERRDA